MLEAYAELTRVLCKGCFLQTTRLPVCICDGPLSLGLGAALTASAGFANNAFWGII